MACKGPRVQIPPAPPNLSLMKGLVDAETMCFGATTIISFNRKQNLLDKLILDVIF
jgi:hypothetical protein